MTAAFDTNVLVYACDKKNPRRNQTARTVLADCEDGVVLWQVACEFLAASRKLHSQGFTPERAWGRLAQLTKLFPRIVPGSPVLDRGFALHTQHQIAFWDAMIFASCPEAGVERIYSEDLPGCPVPGLEIVNPFRR